MYWHCQACHISDCLCSTFIKFVISVTYAYMLYLSTLFNFKRVMSTFVLFFYQDYGKETQAHDVLNEYFKSKRWKPHPVGKWNIHATVTRTCTYIVTYSIVVCFAIYKLSPSSLFGGFYLVNKVYSVWLSEYSSTHYRLIGLDLRTSSDSDKIRPICVMSKLQKTWLNMPRCLVILFVSVLSIGLAVYKDRCTGSNGKWIRL